MTDPNYTAIAVVIDRSGSMATAAEDAEGALAAFIADQAQQPGRCTIRLAEFDNEYRTVYPSTPVADVPAYKLAPRGMTALLDAIGRTITELGEELSALAEDDRPGNVVVVVQTDGGENSSKEWTRSAVFEAINRQRDQFSWSFIFLGANQDAIKTGASMGFTAGSSLTYSASGVGTQAAMRSASAYVTQTRAGNAAAFTDADRQSADSK